MERKPYPFFMSVEFLTVLFKVAATSSPFLIAIAVTGFNAANIAALIIQGVIQGLLLAAKELEIHQNLYTPSKIAGRNIDDAINNIAEKKAKDIAAMSDKTLSYVLNSVPTQDLVDFAVNPSLKTAAKKLIPRLLGRLF